MTDYLIAVCKSCGHTVRISLEHGGRRAKCPKCEGIIEIPKGETSIRLRTDRELTREARAKAGKTGPDTDHDMPGVRSRGKHATARMRRVAPKAGPRRTGLVITLVATAAVIVGIAIVLLGKPAGETGTNAPPSPAFPSPKGPPPLPPSPPPDPNLALRETIRGRVFEYVGVFNKSNPAKIAEFYTCDVDTVRKAFGILPSMDHELKYEDVKIKTFEFADPEVRTTIAFNRILKNTETGASESQPDAERVLTWTKVGEKWMISSPPQP